MSLSALGPIGPVGILYGLLLPLVALQLLTFMFIPSVLVPGARPLQVGKAAYCYLMQALGVLLMSLGALPALHGALSQTPFETDTYLGYLVLFAAGGLVFLMHEHLARTVDEPSRTVPHAIYFFTFKIIGFIATLFAALSLLLAMLFGGPNLPDGWWITPSILLVYGLIISWCTRFESMATPTGITPRPAPAQPQKVLVQSPSMVPASSKPLTKPVSNFPSTTLGNRPTTSVEPKVEKKPAKKPPKKKSAKKATPSALDEAGA